jgi:hypothetical protein
LCWRLETENFTYDGEGIFQSIEQYGIGEDLLGYILWVCIESKDLVMFLSERGKSRGISTEIDINPTERAACSVLILDFNLKAYLASKKHGLHLIDDLTC